MGDTLARPRRAFDTVRALRHPNYRIYFFTMLISFTGTWMQSTAQSWLIYSLTASPWLLGLVAFAGQIPVFLFAPVGGVLADRHSRHRLIILTQTLAMAQALVLAALTLTNHVTVEAVIALAFVLGAVNAFDLPTRQSFVAEMVGREDLMNAIALNSSMINGARIVGPALAGLIVAWVGEGHCFLINGLSYIAVIGGLLSMKLTNREVRKPTGSALTDLKEGFAFIRRTRPVRAVLLLVAFVSIFGLSYIVLMPIFANTILGGGARALGTLLSAAGLGALGGALTLAARREVRGLGRVAAMSVAALGLLLVAFSFSRNIILSATLLVPIGFTLMLQMSASNTLLQTMVPDRLRGRVMSFYSMSLMGMTPFGSLLAGGAAARVGAPWTIRAGGLLCVVGALVFGMRLASLRSEAAQILTSQVAAPGEPAEADTIESLS
ncbi:MAG TPA: MFS transporter [Blastocatellia bacterium]|nr:MFS transporter [Blastocatellia bacterium]